MEPLKDVLFSAREAKSLTIEKVVIKTGIHTRYVEHLETGEYYRLPPDAYVYGYIRKLAFIYNLNVDELWDAYKTEKGELVRSGASDYFPGSRSMEKEKERMRNWPALISVPAVLGILVVGYVLWQANGFIQPPELHIENPSNDITVLQNTYTVVGSVGSRTTLTINEEIIQINDGEFERVYTLQEGLNTFIFRARHLLGRETTLTRQIVFTPIDTGVDQVSDAVDRELTTIENN